LLRKLDGKTLEPQHSKKWRDHINRWWNDLPKLKLLILILVMLMLILGGIFLFLKSRETFNRVAIAALSMVNIGYIIWTSWNLARVYFGWSSNHASQIEREMAREDAMIGELKHAPKTVLKRRRKRIDAEIDFFDKLGFFSMLAPIPALILQFRPHPPEIIVITALSAKSSANQPLANPIDSWTLAAVVLVASAVFFQCVSARLVRKFRRLAYVLGCAEDEQG
jgi:hypothetical protein